MAVPLSNHSSLFSPRLSASFSSPKPSKTVAHFKPLHYHHSPHLCKPILGFLPLTKPSPISNSTNCRRSFQFHLSARDSVPTTNGEEEASQNDVKTAESEADQQQQSSLKILIEVYKEAILAGDEKTVSDIEARIHIIENEKNELAQKVSALSIEMTTGKEKYIRLQADFDNFRKRSEKERLTIRSDAQGDVIESLLPMVDNFERAKQQLKPETEKEKKIDASYQGIYKQFVEIMRSLRVAAVATVGKPFDPSLHEAIAREESQEFQEGIVTQEFRRGFLLGDRLLRPAMVKVSSGPCSVKAPAAADKSTDQPATAAGVDER
ncbi:uncharacterized protein LOC132168113 [Corylus avellana]|uniref:uncharacterized protein LOC132168113 n=1 Tax=Corylus avellana TaxID=13451 RepID=UPI00286C319C|nr:uncharacterized protein LOC132168113 [Corylus avellana]